MSGGPALPGGASGADEREWRAAEYVLGTLPLDERQALERARLSDPATESAIRGWERRLSPLALTMPEAPPPPRVWDAIARGLQGGMSPANDNRIEALARQVQRWRLAAGGAGLLAAGLALFVAVGPRPAEQPGFRYVAVVQSGGALPALIVSVDTASGTAQVRPVSAEAPSGRSLELWYVGADSKPKTLGVIGSATGRVTLPADVARAGAGVFAVSVEPPGGSPTGQPTGQVLYTGKLIRD